MRTAILLALLFFPACSFAEDMKLRTVDGWTLSAVYKAPARGKACVLFAHGLGSDRGEWNTLGSEIEKKGLGWLAFDMRGHGASKESKAGPRGYESFTDQDWGDAVNDLEAGASFLRSTGCVSVAFVGASIGADLAVKAAARGPVRPVALVLLSPGLDYHGVQPLADFIGLPADVRILMAAARQDEYSFSSMLALYERKIGGPVKPLLLSAMNGHGVQMFAGHSAAELDLLARIAGWLAQNAVPAKSGKKKRR